MSASKTLQSSQPKQRSALGQILSWMVVLIGAALLFLYGYAPVDWVKSSLFTPSAQLAAAEQRIDFAERGKQIFYATHPSIENKSQFNKSCASTERTVAILGCYAGDNIYLYNIQNAELDGTLEVTAAHEMLHAAYQRLNYFDRKHVNELVKAEYEKIKDKPSISQLMEYYRTAEPGAELDELHSIIGTTILEISPTLENYYRSYFTDRASVVALNNKYSAVFDELSARADELQKTIDSEGPAIANMMQVYQTDLAQLNLDIQSFNARAASGGFSTQSEFATARNALERRVDTMNGRRSSLNARVNNYNAMVDELNKLAVHVNKLNESINGVDAPSGI